MQGIKILLFGILLVLCGIGVIVAGGGGLGGVYGLGLLAVGFFAGLIGVSSRD